MVHQEPNAAPRQGRGQEAEQLVAKLFADAGWEVEHQPKHLDGQLDLLIKRGRLSYAAEIKAAAEGRADRLIPLWSQACLQASRGASGKRAPLAVVVAPAIRPAVARQILDFARENAPEVGAGVIDFRGWSWFQGSGLQELNREGSSLPADHWVAAVQRESGDLFSDLGQWILKVLLAADIPDHLLKAPREPVASALQLSKLAQVSVPTAHRFVAQLRREGFLHESRKPLKVVRREELLHRWQSASARSVREVPLKLLLGKKGMIGRVLREQRACLALFDAASALGFGLVSGVPPYVYLPRLDSQTIAGWQGVAMAEPGETPDLIVRQAPAPESVFRGKVVADGMPVSDIIQVWLDVAAHPTRGREQADLIWRKVLRKVADAGES